MIRSKYKKAFPHLVALIVFIVLNCTYFYPQLNGKKGQSGDLVSYQGMTKELDDFRIATQEDVLWTNAMFGGMPSFQMSTPRNGNKIKYLEKIQQVFFKRPIGYFNALMIGFYLMMVLLRVDPWIALLGSVAFAYSTNHFIFFEAGHMTKLRAIAYFPFIVSGVILCFRKKWWAGGVLFATGMAMDIHSNHLQMTYYLGMVLILYVLIETVAFIRRGEWKDLMKTGIVLSIGLILAVASASSIILTTYEHTKHTMRGKPILEKEANVEATSSSEVDGLEWNYAMQWSNGMRDLMTAVVPGAVGGSTVRKISQESAFAQEVRRLGSRTDQAPLYWGKLPFTSGPIYYGIVMVFLFLMGLGLIKGKLKWWVLAGVILTFAVSLGKNFEVLNRLIFDHLPMFNKFRAPSSITSVTALLIPFLGVLALDHMAKDPNKVEVFKWMKIVGGGLAAVLLIMAVAGPAVFDFSAPRDVNYQQQAGLVDALISDRKALLRGDALRSLLFVGLTTGALWLYVTNKIKRPVLLAAVGLLSLVDLWGVGKRYLDSSHFIAERAYANQFNPRPIDENIFSLEPKGRGFYRVLDLSIATFESSETSYFHNTVGGYHPAKLQRYQDLIARHITKGNIGVLNMLNTKYIIDQNGQLQVNNDALGPAWYVEAIEKVSSPNQEIDVLASMDPSTVAVVLDSEFGAYVGDFDPEKRGLIDLESYAPHHLKYSTSASSDQFAVFSEIWYGPDKGWQAYIDGEPVDHIRVNYVLRGMKIPSGNHEIEFIFKPKIYFTGERLSLIFSLIIIGLLGTFVGKQAFEFWKSEEPKPAAKQPQTKRVSSKRIKKTVRKKKKK